MLTMKTTTIALVGASLLGLSALTSAVMAESHGADPIAQRMELMKGVGAHTKAIGGMMSTGTIDWAAVAEAGAYSQEVAATFGDLFPEGSFVAPSEASDAIELDGDTFQAILAKYGQDGAALQAAAMDEDMDALKVAFGAYTSNCKTCHSQFKQQK